MRLPPGPSFSVSAVERRPGPAWLRERRLASWERFVASPAPSESEEIWRYSRIDDLELDRYRPAEPAEAPATAGLSVADLPPEVGELVRSAGPAATVVVSRNGATAGVAHPQPGLTVSPAAGHPIGDASEAAVGGPADPFVALNEAFAWSPWRVTVAPGSVLANPVVLVHWLEGETAAHFPRLEVEVGEEADARVLEVVAGEEADMLVVPFSELAVGRGARLGYGQVQLLGPRAWQVANQVSRVAAGGVLRSMTVALGGYYARVRTDSVLEGEGGDTELLAAYFGAGDQMHDLRTVQHHAAPNSRSDLLFKGAVADQAHSVYSGLIKVEKGAHGTNAFQTNRNLVLAGGARAYSVPNLEIEDNDVRCSHASAVGPVDEAQLFYLESRGVPTPAAERLIVLGFLDDVLLRFPVVGALSWLRRALAAKFDQAGLGNG
jgi:Fe-S cluster assembly protein SufD